MKIFKIKNYEVLLDDEDYERVVAAEQKYSRRWSVKRRDNRVFMACYGVPLALSRFILNYYGLLYVDHINRNTLDNRKENLRVVSPSANGLNSKIRKNNSSGANGVSCSNDGRKKPWIARIAVEGKDKFLGSFETREEAIQARKAADAFYGKPQ